MRPFTFLVDDYTATSAAELGERARRAEALGATTFVIPDHLVPMMAPIPYLATVAAATERIRIAAFVHNNDLRHPVILAKDLATLDVLSGGRLDVAIGAGWNKPEYDAIGLPFDPVGVRVSRLTEAVAIIKGCFGPRAVQLRRRALHDHRLRRPAEARPATPSADLHRWRRQADADPGGSRGRTSSGSRRGSWASSGSIRGASRGRRPRRSSPGFGRRPATDTAI